MKTLTKLFYPLSFLLIRHRDNVYFYVVYPFILSVGFLLFNYAFGPVEIVGPGGLIEKINTLLSILAAFYIAALAAIATFNKPDMDNLMKGEPPILREEKLTRRQYLSLLFGYLAFMTIGIFFCGVGANIYLDGANVTWIVKTILTLVYFFVLFNIIVVTLLGLYFLCHRIHKDDIEIKRE